MNKTLVLVISIVLTISLMFGCAPSADVGMSAGTETSAGTGTSADAAEAPTRTDLNLMLPMTVATFDPYYNVSDPVISLLANVYEPLVAEVFKKQVDGTVAKEFEPRLAESYDISEDGITYTFHIRQGVKFHDKSELKASDVVFSFNRAMESPVMQSYTGAVSEVRALDNKTVMITLRGKSATFINDLCNIIIMSENFVTTAGEKIAEQTCGTGPYYLYESVPDQKYKLNAFESYYRGEASIKTLTYKVIPDQSTMVIAFESGELDMMQVPASSWEQIRTSEEYKTYSYALPRPYFITMNLEKAPFDNLMVRQAINYAIDRESINTIAFEGTGIVADSMVPDVVFGACKPDNQYIYNPEKAKELLAEAGYTDGLEISAIKTLGGEASKAAQVIQRNFAEVGITCDIETVEGNTLFAAFGTGAYDIAIGSIGLPYDFQYWRLIFTTQFINVLNMGRYSNPTVDGIFDTASQEMDLTVREGMYKNAVNIISDDAVYAPFVYATNLTATNANLCFDVPVESVTCYDMYWTN